MNLKTSRRNPNDRPIKKPFSHPLANPFRKHRAISENKLIHPFLAKTVTPANTPDWCLLKPYTKIRLDCERQQIQGRVYASITPLR